MRGESRKAGRFWSLTCDYAKRMTEGQETKSATRTNDIDVDGGEVAGLRTDLVVCGDGVSCSIVLLVVRHHQREFQSVQGFTG